jgi:hypothetical protein
MVILVRCFNKRFLIELSQLYFKHAYDLFSSRRVRNRILYLLAVNEIGYDLFTPEG